MLPLFVATILMGGFAVVVRFGQRRGGDSLCISATNYVVAALCFVPLFRPFPLPEAAGRTLAIGVTGGVFYASAYMLMLPVLTARGVAITSAAMRLSVVIPMLLSLFLWQEVPNTWQGVGALLALTALPFLVAGRARNVVAEPMRWGAVLVAGLFMVNGGCSSITKLFHVLGRVEQRPVFFALLFGTAAVYASTVWLMRSRQRTWDAIAVGAFLGVVNAGANFALISALDHFSGVVVFPVTAAGGLVFAVVFSAIAWRERPNRWGLLGVALAVIAVTLVNLATPHGSAVHRPEPMTSPFGQPDRSGGAESRSERQQERTEPMTAEPTDLAGLWDLRAIAQDPLHAKVLQEGATGWGAGRVRTREVRYTSHRWQGGEVVIAAHVALPAAEEPMPAIIMGTGDAEAGIEFARKHRVAAIAIDRPGTGESTGPEDDYRNWVHFSDPRESWMWHYITAALRAVTLAGALPEVDASRIGITGGSRGGTMAWIANGVDPRIKLAIPVATGGDIVRALDHGGWANYLHRDEAGQAYIPDEFHTFARYFDPILYAGKQHGAVLLIVGAQDEYFPLYCTATSAEASAGDEFRLLVIANWDHGYFGSDNPEVDAFDNSQEAARKRGSAVGAAIEAYLRGGRMPRTPTMHVKRAGDTLECSITVGEGPPVRRVAVQASFDGAYTFEESEAHQESEGFVATVRATDTAALEGAALFAEVEYKGGPVLTSAPWLGAAFEQRMRPFPEPEG
jgi:cephalosporin-C deacetylase-like acetyl esterase/drug/metabolite transporter (DMT)-like permease